jgi:hypothetical protein
MTDEWILSIGGMRMTGKTEVLEEKPVPLPFCSTEILHRWLWYGRKRFFTLTITDQNSVGIFQLCHTPPFSSFFIHLLYLCFFVAVYNSV